MRRDPKRNTKLLSPLLTRKGDTKWMAPRTCCSLPHHAIVRAGARWVGILPVLSPNIDGRSFPHRPGSSQLRRITPMTRHVREFGSTYRMQDTQALCPSQGIAAVVVLKCGTASIPTPMA
jgi:hypothetical protein